MNILKQKFITQRTGARNRNIEWHFTFESWLAWWGDDIANRGNRSGQLVMARLGDQGPYHPDNVKKITCNENASEGNAGIPAPQKACPGPRNGMFGKVSAMRGRKQTQLGLTSILQRANSEFNSLVRDQLSCPHCNKTSNKGNMLRWHFNNGRLVVAAK